MTKVQKGGTKTDPRYFLYLPKDWVQYIQEHTGREEIKGVTLQINDIKLLGHSGPRHGAFGNHKNPNNFNQNGWEP